jgi:hypothetical protein
MMPRSMAHRKAEPVTAAGDWRPRANCGRLRRSGATTALEEKPWF